MCKVIEQVRVTASCVKRCGRAPFVTDIVPQSITIKQNAEYFIIRQRDFRRRQRSVRLHVNRNRTDTRRRVNRLPEIHILMICPFQIVIMVSIRKLQLSDQAFDDNQAFELVDGESIDMYKVKKPAVKQTNFYGSITWQKQSPTIYKDQLDVAFSSPGEFAQFYSMIAENVANQIEQANENMARAILCNFIAGRIVENNTN